MNLVIFGDSFCYGDELSPLSSTLRQDEYRLRHCFAGLIAEHYQLQLINYAYPGNSILGTVQDFFFWLKNSNEYTDSLVLFGITSPSRTSWTVHDHFPNRAWPHKTRLGLEPDFVYRLPSRISFHSPYLENHDVPPPANTYQKLHQTWRKECYSEKFEILDYQQAVFAVDGAAQSANFKILQFNLYEEPKIRFEPQSLIPRPSLNKVLLAANNDRNLRAPKGHPNELGHKLISEFLISHIDSRKMLG